MTKEPLIIIGAVVVALNAFQSAAIPLPAWAHALIFSVTAGLGFIVARSQVTPTPPAHTRAPRKRANAGRR